MSVPNVAEELFKVSVEKLAAFFEQNGITGMRQKDLESAGLSSFASGWAKKLQFSDGQTFTIAVLLKNDFPFVPPRLAVLDGPSLLTWPHLEPNGLMCVFSSEAAFDVQDPVGQVSGLLHEGVKLIERILTGEAEEDFRDEFVSYWSHSVDDGSTRFLSLLDPAGSHRHIFIWRGKQQYIVSDSEGYLQNWLTRQYGLRKDGAAYQIGKALFLRSTRVLTPDQYPRNAGDLRTLFSDDRHALDMIAMQALQSQLREVIIAFSCPTGIALAPVTIALHKNQTVPGRKSPDPMTRGFRKGRVPVNVAVLRSTSPLSRVTRHALNRADHDWIHGRDADPHQKILKNKKVLVVGCGSLGSTVAELLAKAGIGNLGLIDGQFLEWPNISRHVLGAESIGRAKAENLSQRLQKAFPHLCNIRAFDGQLLPSSQQVLMGWDLVIGTTGIWPVDAFIDERHKAGDFPLALYAWLEPHAVATHAVTVAQGGACLRCNFSKTGKPDLTYSEWKNDGLLPIPACGGNFNPYGATDLSFAHGLVGNEAISALTATPVVSRETIWVGPTTRVASMGGKITEQWRQTMGDPGHGGFLSIRQWPRKDNCAACARMVEA